MVEKFNCVCHSKKIRNRFAYKEANKTGVYHYYFPCYTASAFYCTYAPCIRIPIPVILLDTLIYLETEAGLDFMQIVSDIVIFLVPCE